MNTAKRQILLINLVKQGPVKEENIKLREIDFKLVSHSIGWNFDLAEDLIHNFDGVFDAIAVSGVQRRVGVGNFTTSHPGYLRLLRAATKSQIYVADDIREFFAEWTINRLLKQDPNLFTKRSVLFHCAVASPTINKIAAAGAIVYAADPLIIARIKRRLKGLKQIETFARAGSVARQLLAFHRTRPLSSPNQILHNQAIREWMKDCDVFVGFGNMMTGFTDFSFLDQKLVIVDYADASTKEKMLAAGACDVIELIPYSEHNDEMQTPHASVLAAMLDLKRQAEDSPLDFQNYVLDWYQQSGVKPRRRLEQKSLPRRCAFIIHPLHREMLWMAPGAAPLRDSPDFIKNQIERVASRLPIFKYGELKGIVSQRTGQQVVCDFYAMPATPKEIMAMDEESLYNRLLAGVELARKNGASLIGLGAYTKVAGDAGLTVSRRALIPVTNGNSYSASTSLWAAREMVEKLDLISKERVGSRFKAKAMIIGASGSIGRVSSLLVSLVFQDLILVANRADRLLELREEILALSPDCNVRISTRAESDLNKVDLIVSATSNHSGSTFDIRHVKPGAVIVDCSRPVDVGPTLAKLRPDVLVIESGEVLLPGPLQMSADIGLPKPTVYACTAETILLAMEGRFESFSVGKQLSMLKVKEIYKLGEKHGAKLGAIRGPLGVITEDTLRHTRELALKRIGEQSVTSRRGLELNL